MRVEHNRSVSAQVGTKGRSSEERQEVVLDLDHQTEEVAEDVVLERVAQAVEPNQVLLDLDLP